MYNETANLRELIYQEKAGLSKQIEEEAGKVRSDIAGEQLKLTEDMQSEYSKLKTELESTQKQLSEELAVLKKNLEAIQNARDSKDDKIEELKEKLKQIDVNKNEAKFVFEINDVKEFLKDDKSPSRRISDFFQCRGRLRIETHGPVEPVSI